MSKTRSEGAYGLVSPMDLLGKDLLREVEGFRKGWKKRLKGNFNLLSDAEKRGYLAALYVLRNEALPAAYLRSLPVSRFQAQLAMVIRELAVKEEPAENPRKIDAAINAAIRRMKKTGIHQVVYLDPSDMLSKYHPFAVDVENHPFYLGAEVMFHTEEV